VPEYVFHREGARNKHTVTSTESTSLKRCEEEKREKEITSRLGRDPKYNRKQWRGHPVACNPPGPNRRPHLQFRRGADLPTLYADRIFSC
jgi:hypothetical protein